MRIVSFSPLAAEIVCALGRRPALVGRGAACALPDDIAGVPVLDATDAAALAALAPDRVIASDAFAAQSLAALETAIAEIGGLMGEQAAAARLSVALRGRLDAVRASVSAAAHKPTVAVLSALDPLFGGEAWIMEQIECAGGRPMIGETGQAAQTLSWDDVVWVQPEMVILAARGCDVAEGVRRFDTLAGLEFWRDLPATYLNQIYVADGGLFAQPGPRAVDGVEALAGLLHPNLRPFPAASQAQRVSQLLRIQLHDE